MKLTFIVVLTLICIFLLVGNFTPSLLRIIPTRSLELKINSLSTDKQVYHSNEPMNISLDVYASKNTQADFKVFGIKDRRGNYRLDQFEKRNLTSGINAIYYSYTTPSCYGCAGIDPGKHQITTLVSCENITINKTIEIQIES